MAKNKVIMRCAKLKTFGNIGASLSHNYRERETPNADPERTKNNIHLVSKNTDEAMGRLRDLLPEKRRKDAVLAVEYVMSASPDWWKQASEEQHKEFYSKSLGWISDKYGRENLISFSVHKDETSPHVSCIVVPVTEQGKLSATHFIGSRGKLRADQTSYAKAVQHLGLERGIEGSKSTHKSIREYYAEVSKAETRKPPRMPPEMFKPRVLEKGGLLKKDVLETPEQVAERIEKTVHQHYEPMWQRAQRYDALIDEINNADVYKQKAERYKEELDNLEQIHNRETRNLRLEVRQLKKEVQRQDMVIGQVGLGFKVATEMLNPSQQKQVKDAIAEHNRERERSSERGRGR